MAMHRRTLLLAALGCWVGPGALRRAAAADAPLIIVSSESSGAYDEAARSLVGALGEAGLARDGLVQWTLEDLVAARRDSALPAARAFVALGTAAAELLADERTDARSTPVLCALLPRTSFDAVLQRHGRRASSRLTAIYLDQPLARQMALIQLALPQARRVGVLLGPESAARQPALREAAQAAGLTLVAARVEPQVGIFPALKRVLDDSDVLQALPDAQVYNSGTLQNILLACLRNEVPLVGFSPAYVRAGALLSVHQTPHQAGQQAAALLHDLLQGRPLPASPVESNDFDVEVNRHVADALNLRLDAQALRLALKRREHLP